jgi:diguanylate cyclase (GGDEF)-like protein/PAS domain S-box-containing protein
MFNGHSAIMLLIDPQAGIILDANQSAINFYGYSLARFQGMSFNEINVLPAEQVAIRLQEALNGETNIFVSSHRVSSGEERIVEVHSSPITLQEKQVLFSIIHDVTERKRAEEALKESELHYRAVAQSANEAIISSNASGCIIGWNKGAEVIFGYSESEVLGSPLTLVMSPDLQSAYWASAGYENVVVEKRIVGKTIEMKGRRKDGHEFPLEISLAEWQDKTEICYTAIIRDITARKQVELNLRQSEERYRTLFNSMMDGIYRSTHEGRFVDVNPAMVRMFGYSSREEMLAVDIKKDLYFAPEERGSHILDTGQEEIEVYRMRRKDGSEIWVEDHGHYVHDEQGNILYHEGMLRDISGRKRAENELYQAKEALEIAHKELQEAFAREQQLARIDMLTGVNNRRYLFEIAAQEFQIAARYGLPLSVLMFDVDEFKVINDNFGHVIGDQALQRLTQIVRAQLRSADVLGRYGGDEFIVLLPQTGASEAKILGERIHISVASMRMETKKGVISLTISLGIAQMFHRAVQPDTVEELFQRADQALYAAKQSGRNRTVIFETQ